MQKVLDNPLKSDKLPHGRGSIQQICERVVRLFEREETLRTAAAGVVFVRLRAGAEAVCVALQRVLGTDRVSWVHSGLPAAVRAERAAWLREGRRRWVVATDCWSAGVDLPVLSDVVLTGGSSTIAVVQRAGRASRVAAGKEGFRIWDCGPLRGRARRLSILSSAGYNNGIEHAAPAQTVEIDGDEALILERMLQQKPFSAPRSSRSRCRTSTYTDTDEPPTPTPVPAPVLAHTSSEDTFFQWLYDHPFVAFILWCFVTGLPIMLLLECI